MDIRQIMAMRKEILKKIGVLNQKITTARDIISKLTGCSQTLMREANHWEASYSVFCAAPITGEVFVADLFEGDIAEELNSQVPDGAAHMNNTKGQMQALCSHINNQISKLTEYIAKLQSQITALQAELSALHL